VVSRLLPGPGQFYDDIDCMPVPHRASSKDHAMGFLDNLKDKAEEFGERAKEGFEAAKDKAGDLVGDVKERIDKDETSQDKVEAAADYSPESVAEASKGIDDAVAESKAAAEASAPPAVDPLDPAVESAETTEPTAGLGAVADEPVVAPDPLDGTPDHAVAGEPAEPMVAPDDPLDGTPDRSLAGEPVDQTVALDDPLDGTSDDDLR
jgi:hypothetical protein